MSDFPKLGSEWESTNVAYSVECSPVTADVRNHKRGRWLRRGEWERIPLADGDGLGVPNVSFDAGIQVSDDLFTLNGALAIQHQFLAQAEMEAIEWKTRIIRHEIDVTYKDTEMGIVF